MNSAELLEALAAVLAELSSILPRDKREWDGSRLVRLAVERLWIVAGNTAEAYRRSADVATGVEPWAELVGYRNLLANAMPGELATDRVWADTTTDLSRIIDHVESLRAEQT